MPHGKIVRCPFFVTGRQPAELLKAVEEPFDAIALSINRFIKWTFSAHVVFLCNRESNTSAAQKTAYWSATISFVADNASRPYLRPATAKAFDRTTGHQRLKRRGFVALARREHQGDWLTLAFSSDMDLRAEATATAT